MRLIYWLLSFFKAKRKPYTVADILEMAIEQKFYKAIPLRLVLDHADGSPFMCTAVSVMFRKKIITKKERDEVHEQIKEWLKDPVTQFTHTYLYQQLKWSSWGLIPDDFVKRQGIPFYRSRIQELRDRGFTAV